MTLPVIQYGDPVLRKKGARVEQITPAIQQLIADMFETMEAASGVGLAAQQVGQALQLLVVDVREAKDRPSTLFLGGQPADVAEFMPLALLNPQITPLGAPVAGPEGCLSFPELYADVSRPESIEVKALGKDGQPLEFRCGGLLARAIQHELDHLNGILFIDRMGLEDRLDLKPKLDQLQFETKASLAKKAKKS
jgi:peptide deformylase